MCSRYSTVRALYLSICSICWAWMMHVRHIVMINRKSSWKRRGCSSLTHHPLVGTQKCKLLCPLSRTWRLSTILVLLLHYGDFRWYTGQCSLFGRCPLLGESTVVYYCSFCWTVSTSSILSFYYHHVTDMSRGQLDCQVIFIVIIFTPAFHCDGHKHIISTLSTQGTGRRRCL